MISDVKEERIAESNMKMATAVLLISGGTTVYSIDIAGPLQPLASVYSMIKPATETPKFAY